MQKERENAHVNAIRQQHMKERKRVIAQLMKMSIHQLIEDYLQEMDLKNKSYFFILQEGRLEAFQSYSKNQKNQVA